MRIRPGMRCRIIAPPDYVTHGMLCTVLGEDSVRSVAYGTWEWIGMAHAWRCAVDGFGVSLLPDEHLEPIDGHGVALVAEAACCAR